MDGDIWNREGRPELLGNHDVPRADLRLPRHPADPPLLHLPVLVVGQAATKGIAI